MATFRITAPCSYVQDGKVFRHSRPGAIVELDEAAAAKLHDCAVAVETTPESAPEPTVDASAAAPVPEPAPEPQGAAEPPTDAPEVQAAEHANESTDAPKPKRKNRGRVVDDPEDVSGADGD